MPEWPTSAQARVQRGDVILAINGSAVASIEQLRDQMDRGGKHIAMLVKRGERKMFVPIKIG